MGEWICFVIEMEIIFVWGGKKCILLVKSKFFMHKKMKYEQMKNKKWLEICDFMIKMK